MNDFDYEVMQRKRLAHQAAHRKRGSKSKKCPLSTDYMTQKQWKERCGEVATYQLGRPMVWEDFKKLPVHIQKEYLLDMIQRYSVTASDLARMFGITASTVTRHCGNDEIGISFSPGRRMPKDKRSEFAKLLSGDKAVEPEPIPVQETTPQVSVEETPRPPSMAMTEFSLCFEGALSPEAITNSMRMMVKPGTQVKLEVRCSVLSF